MPETMTVHCCFGIFCVCLLHNVRHLLNKLCCEYAYIYVYIYIYIYLVNIFIQDGKYTTRSGTGVKAAS